MKKPSACLTPFLVGAAIVFSVAALPYRLSSQVSSKGLEPIPVKFSFNSLKQDVIKQLALDWKRDSVYVNKVVMLCWEVYLNYSVPPAVTLSIFEQESGNAGANQRPDGTKNMLFLWHNVCFGLKAHPGADTTPYWDGSVVEVDHEEELNGQKVSQKAKFRSYPNLYNAFMDWGFYLKNTTHYSDAFDCDDLGYKCFVKCLEPKYGESNGKLVVKEPGYSTSKYWGANILKRIYDDQLPILFK